MRTRATLLLVLLTALAPACGGDPERADPEHEALREVWADFAAAANRGDWGTWAGLLAPDTRGATAGFVARWFPLHGISREGLPPYRESGRFLEKAIPTLLDAMGPAEAEELLGFLRPSGDGLRDIRVTDDAANAVAGEGSATRAVVFHCVDGAWRITSFGVKEP